MLAMWAYKNYVSDFIAEAFAPSILSMLSLQNH